MKTLAEMNAQAKQFFAKPATQDKKTADSGQKPYFSLYGNTWELLDENGKTIWTTSKAEGIQGPVAQSKLRAAIEKYNSTR